MFRRASAAFVISAIVLISGCTQGSPTQTPDISGTVTPLPTGTPYPTQTTQPTLTPYSIAPTYTPPPTYTLLPTGTPYPTLTAQPTLTPYSIAPTYTPPPTYTPLPTGTPYPTLTILPTSTPYPTYTPLPTGTPYPTLTTLPTPTPFPPAPTYTPYPTPTPQPTPTPAPTPTPLPTHTPAPPLSRLHDTQNTRWIARNYPEVAQRIQSLPWVQDGLTDFEATVIDQLLYLGVGKIDNLEAALRLPWLHKGISDTEYDVIYWLRALDHWEADAASEVIAMPFLESPDATDALALQAMHRLATEGVLSALIESSLFQSGIADTETALVAAVGTLYQNASAVRRVLIPSNADVESVTAGTVRTPDLRISIVRTGSQSRPGTVEAIRDAVNFAEGIMALPLPVDHVIVILDTDAIISGYAGTNYGFAFSYSPEYETRQGTYEWNALQSGFIHEVAHYYWRGHANWIDEGTANTFEYVHGIENGLSRGHLITKRERC